jgi:signal peptidase II
MTADVNSPASKGPSRWLVLGLAALVLIGDLWSKAWAEKNLASPTHPIVALRDQHATPAAALRAAGVDDAALAGAENHGALARLRKLTLLPDQIIAPEHVGQDIVLTSGIGMPAPRRLRLSRDHLGKPLAQVVSDSWWRTDRAQVAQLLSTAGWQASFRPFDPSEPWQAEDAGVALLDRDIPLIQDNLRFVYAENKGAAWSFLESAPTAVRVALFATISSLASLAMIFWLWRGLSTSALMAWAVAAILGGALGNLVDRLHYSVVIDFIYMYVVIDGKTHGWPVYNVADIGISVGVVLIALDSLRGQPSKGSQTAASAPAPDTAA